MNEPKPIIVTQPSPTAVIEGLQHGVSVNVPLLVGTFAILAVLAGAGWFARGYFLRVNTSVYLDRARQAEARGDTDAALQHYGEFLQFSGHAGRRSDAALQQRADVLGQVIDLLHSKPADVPTIRRLYQTYEECLRLNRVQAERRRRFIALLMQVPRYRDALSHLEVWKETAAPGKEAGEVAYLTGACLEAEEQYADCQRAFLQSIRSWPDQTVAYIGLARLWLSQPDQIAPLNDEDVPPGPEWHAVLELVRPAKSSKPVSAAQAAEAVLEAMFARRNGPDSRIATARLLIDQQNSSDRLPSTPAEAETQVRTALSSEDLEPADGTGESPREPLPYLDRWLPQAPAFSDLDRDGRVTPEELRRRFERGDTLSRIDWAERLLTGADSEARGSLPAEVQLALANLYTTKAEVARMQQPEEVAASLKRARESLNAAVGGGLGDIRFVMARLALDLEDLKGGAGEEADRLALLHKAEHHLTAVLERLEGLRAAGHSAMDDWTIGPRLPDFRLIEIELRFDLAGVLLTQNSLVPEPDRGGLRERVHAEVDRLQNLGASSQLVEFVHLREQMAAEEFSKARELAARLQGALSPRSNLSRQVTLLAAECELRMGNADARLDVFRKHLKDDATWIAGRQGLAESLLALGRLDESIEQYRPAAGLPAFGTRLLELLLIRNLGISPAQRLWKEPEALLTYLQERSSETVRVALLGVELRMLQAVTLDTVRQASSDPNQEREAIERLAQAERLLTAVRESHPLDVAVRAAHAGFALRRFDRPRAARLLQVAAILAAARKDLGRKVEFDLLEAAAAVEDSGKDCLDRLLALANSANGLPQADRFRLLSGLARLAAQTGDLQAAANLWGQAAVMEPEDLESRLALAQLLLVREQSDGGEWEQTLQEIARIEQTVLGSVAYLRAERILRERGPADARQDRLALALTLLKSAERTRPYWSAIPRALGLVADLQGRSEEAIESFQRALSLGDRSPEVIRRVVLYYYRRQQFNDADRLLQQVANENADLVTGDLARLAWRVSWNRQQYDQALGVVRRLTENSQSAEDHIALALMQFARGGQEAEIEDALRKAAYELSPDAAEPWTALVSYLARTQQWGKAEAAISDARERLPQTPRPTALLVAGSLFELLAASGAPRQQDYVTEASRSFERALGAAGEDNLVLMTVADHFLRIGAPGRADPLLQSLLNPARNVPAQVRQWARRRLAHVVASGGGYDDTRQAVELLRTVAETGEDRSPANLRLQLQLLDRVASRETRAERVDLLRGLKLQSALMPEEHLQLADLLQAGGDLSGARAEYRALLDEFPKFTRARAAYIRSLIDGTDRDAAALAEAVRQTQFLKEYEPRSWQTAQTQVRLLSLNGKPDEAVARLDEFLNGRVGESVENPLREVLEQENLPLFLSELQRDRRVQAVPSHFAAVMEASRLIEGGKREEAIQALLDGSAAPLLAELRFDVVLKAAQLCEELKLPGAERLLRDYVARSPRASASLALAAYLIRHERVAEALDVCSRNWERLPKSGVGSLLVLAGRYLPTEQRGLLAPWRERLAAELERVDAAERSILAVQLGDFDLLLGAAPSAIAAYRKTLDANPRDVLAWNNLAFLLARHPERPEDLQEAGHAIGEALRLAGPVPGLIDTQAIVYLAQGRPAEALAVLQPLASPDASPKLHLRIAECLLALGRRSEAREAVAQARQKGFSLHELPPNDRPRVETLLRNIAANGRP